MILKFSAKLRINSYTAKFISLSRALVLGFIIHILVRDAGRYIESSSSFPPLVFPVSALPIPNARYVGIYKADDEVIRGSSKVAFYLVCQGTSPNVITTVSATKLGKNQHMAKKNVFFQKMKIVATGRRGGGIEKW